MEIFFLEKNIGCSIIQKTLQPNNGTKLLLILPLNANITSCFLGFQLHKHLIAVKNVRYTIWNKDIIITFVIKYVKSGVVTKFILR